MTSNDNHTHKTIFAKIIDKEIPSQKVFENDRIYAFRDIQPQAPVHILIVPKKPLKNLQDATSDDLALLGEMLLIARQIAEQEGIGDHFRVVTNSGEQAGQTVFHLHLHLLGGKPLGHLC